MGKRGSSTVQAMGATVQTKFGVNLQSKMKDIGATMLEMWQIGFNIICEYSNNNLYYIVEWQLFQLA